MPGEWVNNFIESFLYIVFLNQFHGNRKGFFFRQWGSWIAVFLLFSNITFADSITFFHWSTTIIDCLVVIPYAIFYLQGNFFCWIASMILFNLGLVGSVIISIGISAVFAPEGVGAWLAAGELHRIFLLVLNKLCLLSYMYAILKGKRYIWKRDNRIFYGTILLIPLLVIIMICLVIQLLLQGYDSNGNVGIFVALLLGILVLLIIIIFLYIHAIKKHEKQKENELLLKMMEVQQNSFRKELESFDKLRKIEHDMKNYLLGIKYYIKKGELNTGLEYLDEVLKRLSESGNQIAALSNMETLWETMIAMKFSEARELGIVTRQDIQPGCYEVINPLDLCVILGNILDNAIEAEVRNREQKEINVVMREHHHMVLIKVSNWLDDNQVEEARTLISRKENAMMHGLGLSNVMETVKRYEGRLETEIIENYFIAKIGLQTDKK